MKRWRLLALLLASSAVLRVNATPTDDGSCRNGNFPLVNNTFALAKVTGKPNVYLLKDMEGCPLKGEAACRQRAYVIEGDTLIVGRAKGGYRCVFYPNKTGGNAGWVAADRLRLLPTATVVPSRAWAGQWRNGDDTLQLIPNGDGTLTMNGDAYWPSANPDPQMRPSGPNLGSVTARNAPEGNRLEVSENSGTYENEHTCKVTARLLGDLLVVADNSNCGGNNVSFTGIYRKSP